ncbi:MBL fold metallo-hydrolase [Amantichitinum ursilacus]|uniref:Putative L-ascorbate-6-phosphate lactonase UlaG n=1 Tax=Amantichitinum ursilacus TaxID=857265 RepID=A0A0N1JST6_9NEIS|nr:MBL fold metallo-hydrolase [Amantichitinum ursilacus]KPC52520.1 putative L-ascorbate-6-phosphate lactonase UlaG [Amantichitinum ursilacus]
MNRKTSQRKSDMPPRFKNEEPTRPIKFGVSDFFDVINKLFFDASTRPPAPLPVVPTDWTAFMQPSPQLKLVWLGHSTFVLNMEGKNILLDPVFGESVSPLPVGWKRFQPAPVALEALPHIDFVVISHDHYDHLDETTVRFLAKTTSEFIVPSGMGAWLQRWGVVAERISELDWHGSLQRGSLRFTATPARHESGRGLFDRARTLWASWVITGEQQKLYYSGDSSYGKHFADIGERYGPFDVSIIENGQYDLRWADSHMQPEETIQAAIDLRSKLFVPAHWGMFQLSTHAWDEPVVRSFQLAQQRGLPMATPMLGELTQPDRIHATPWWQAITRPARAKRGCAIFRCASAA